MAISLSVQTLTLKRLAFLSTLLLVAAPFLVDGLPAATRTRTPSSRSLLAEQRRQQSTMSSRVYMATESDHVDDDNTKDWRDEIVEWDWKSVAQDVFADDKRPVVLFDGICNLCNSGVNFAMDQDETAKLRFCSLHSRVAQSLLLREGKSPNQQQISFITETDGYFSSDAVSHICMHLDSLPLQWFGTLGQFTPGWIRESLYQFVSKNRQVLGEADQCRLDFDGTYTSRFVSDPVDEAYIDYTI